MGGWNWNYDIEQVEYAGVYGLLLYNILLLSWYLFCNHMMLIYDLFSTGLTILQSAQMGIVML